MLYGTKNQLCQNSLPEVIHGEGETEGSISVLTNPDGVDQLGLEVSPGGQNVLHQRLEDVRPVGIHLDQLLLQFEQPGPAVCSLEGFIIFILEVSQLLLHFVNSELGVKH